MSTLNSPFLILPSTAPLFPLTAARQHRSTVFVSSTLTFAVNRNRSTMFSLVFLTKILDLSRVIRVIP
jgi:hypothetical protein